MALHDFIPSYLEKKCRALDEVLAPHERIAVAYSGGGDSTFLAWYAQRVLNKTVYAILASTPLLSERELGIALTLAEELGFALERIPLDTASIPQVGENTKERCYFCKKEVMTRVKARAEELGCTAVVDGSHAGDRKVYRPGARAIEELGILSPLAVAGLEKKEIRELSRLAGLSTWNRPSQSCLATRIPYGTPLTPELLSRIDRAETLLYQLGCEQVRVRSHGDTARIEVPPELFPLLTEEKARKTIVEHFRLLGFLHVSLDLAGYRSGSWDEADAPAGNGKA